MPKANLIQSNFSSGEVSPQMRGRVDVTKYFNGAAELLNFIVKPQGGITRRPGTRFVREVKTSSKATVVVPFQFSTVQAYILEFGNLYVRVYRDGGVVESSPGVPLEVVTPYTDAEVSSLYFTQSADVLYICHPDHQPRKLTRTSHTSWVMSLYSPDDGPYMDVDSGTDTMTVSGVSDTATMTASASTFVSGDVGKFVEYREDGIWKLAKISGYTSGTVVTVDVVDNIIRNIDPVVKLTLSSSSVSSSHSATFTTESVGQYVRLFDGSWRLVTGYSSSQLVPSSAVTLVSVTYPTTVLTVTGRAITATLTCSGSKFAATDVGRLFRLDFLGKQVWGTITAYTSATVVSVTLEVELPADRKTDGTISTINVTDRWRLGAWSDTTGWPAVACFHEQRLTFARTKTQPQTVWMSVSGDYENHAPSNEDSTVVDDNAVTYTLVSNQVNEIAWMDSGPVLLIGTTSSEWQASATSIREPITPTNISVTNQTAFGSIRTGRPKRVGPATLFVQLAGRKVREMVYDFNIDAYAAKDLTIISEHILRKGTRGVVTAFQQEPNSVLWVALENGALAAMTYIRDQEVIAWHYHEIGGDGVVESLASIPSVDATENVIYMVVRRTINGATKRYIEYLEQEFHPATASDKNDMFFVDCGLTYDGAAVSTVSGLDHLEGEEVAVVGDGAVQESRTVSGGAITLAREASVVHVGLSYRSLVKSLPLEGGSQMGTSQGKIKRVERIDVRLVDSLGLKYGTDPDALRELSFRSTTGTMGQSPDLFTGDKSIYTDGGYNPEASYVIAQDLPYPLTILAVMPVIHTNE